MGSLLLYYLLLYEHYKTEPTRRLSFSIICVHPLCVGTVGPQSQHGSIRAD